MICQFKRLIYPKAVTAGDASYMIALYRPCEKVMDAAGNVVSEIKAVGYCLPTADNLRYDMRGRWSRSAKHGIQFEVEGFDEVIVPSKEGVIAYLCSGQIKGIGPKTAEKIYAMFGQNTLTVLDHEPEQLLAVSGISKTKLKKICDSYLASRGLTGRSSCTSSTESIPWTSSEITLTVCVRWWASALRRLTVLLSAWALTLFRRNVWMRG